MLEMKPEVRKEWCAALRSGEYEQTTGTLRRDTPTETRPAGYCCMGVLTDLYVKAGGDEVFYPQHSDGTFTLNLWEDGALSWPVMEWAGLEDSNPNFGGTYAAYHNDVARRSFAEIADLIDDGEGRA